MTDFEFMTYKAASERLKIAVSSVKRQAARRKWPKRKGNDGRVTIGIPIARLSAVPSPDGQGDCHPPAAILVQLARLEAEIAGLRSLVDAECRRADAAESDRDAWRDMAQRPWWKRLARNPSH